MTDTIITLMILAAIGSAYFLYKDIKSEMDEMNKK